MPPAGLEPATLWLEATRAIRLRHEGWALPETESGSVAPKATMLPLHQRAKN